MSSDDNDQTEGAHAPPRSKHSDVASSTTKPPLDTNPDPNTSPEPCIAVRLPTEILLQIFLDLMFHGLGTSSNRWISISHVCSRWRNVALECPRLWIWPSFRKPACADAMISRAAHMPLNIIVNLNRFNRCPGIWKAFSSLPKAQTLSMQGLILSTHWGTFDKWFLGKLLSAPLLETITVSAANNRMDRDRCLSEAFRLHAPQLRQLTLHNWGVEGSPVSLQSCPRLTTLEIRLTGYCAARQDSVQTILTCLRPLQALQNLRLYNVLSSDKTIYSIREIPTDVCLSSIKNITVHDKPSMCLRFFQALKYPDEGVTISINSFPALEETFRETAAFHIRDLAQTLTSRLREPVRALHVTPTVDGHPNAKDPFIFRFWNTPNLQEFNYVSDPPQISITAPFSVKIFDDLCNRLRLQDLQHLMYHLETSQTQLWKGFGELRHLWLVDVKNTHWGLLKTIMAPWGAELVPPKKKKGEEEEEEEEEVEEIESEEQTTTTPETTPQSNSEEESPTATTPTTPNSPEARPKTIPGDTPSSPRPPTTPGPIKPTSVSDQKIYFKALRDLTLSNWVPFDGYRHTWIEPPVLAKGMAKRREHGFPLASLQIWGCEGFMYEDVEELVQVVDEVYWDGNDFIDGPDGVGSTDVKESEGRVVGGEGEGEVKKGESESDNAE